MSQIYEHMDLLCKWGGKYRGSLLAENWFELLPKTEL